jgi:radical SAM/Cys-rich protein
VSAAFPLFEDKLRTAGLFPLTATGISVFQINVGKLCNQTCRHCHVEAGPDRKERMTRETAELCMDALAKTGIATVDITGGAPELNANFRYVVECSKELGRHVLDRSNLTVLLLPSQAGLAQFLAQHQVEIVASLPYFLEQQTDAQRGSGVFSKSMEAIRLLNSLGYGAPGSGLTLNFVFNPAGAFLPPAQHAIEADFRRELRRRYGVEFNSLYALANVPIGRFRDFLDASGNYEPYMQRLVSAYNPVAAAGVMCRYTLSVGWDGALYDCDFNQMLGLETDHGAPAHIRDFSVEMLNHRQIVTGQHCYACTAGGGSSCTGASVR